MFKFLSGLCLVGLLSVSSALHAQALPAAGHLGGTFQAGVGAMFLDPDYDTRNNGGLSTYLDYDFSRYLGVEAIAHFGGIISPTDLTENSYLAGPRGTYRRGKAAVYGKVLFGYATIRNQDTDQSSGFKAFAFGGGLEYQLSRHYNIRAVDVELQKWPDFEPHTLSPLSVTVGIAYTFH